MLGVNASRVTNGSAKVREKAPLKGRFLPATTSPRSDKKFRMGQLRRGLSSFWRKKIPPMVMKNSRGGCVADLISVSTRTKSTVSVGRGSCCCLSTSRNHCLLAGSREMG